MESALITALEILAEHGYLIIFFWMLADQAALPLPAVPLLVAGGALSSTGELDLTAVIVIASIATVIADSLWYALGRYNGASAISLVCKMSIEPDSCVTTTRTAFVRFGSATLIVAKYLPGVQTLAPASAGFVKTPLWGFLLLDLAGTLLFVVPFVLAGYYFAPQLVELMRSLADVSGGITALVGGIVGIYLLVKLSHWLVFLRQHRLRRISADELNSRLQRDDPVTVVDLRQRLDFQVLPQVIPGALRIPLNELKARRAEVPVQHDIVLVCT